MSTVIAGQTVTPPNAGGGASILDSVAVKNAMEAYTIENYFQGKLHVEGRGYTSRYVTDMSLRSVSIPHQLLPSLGIAREVGATNNGAAINQANIALIGGQENGYLEDDVYNVNLTYVFDQFFYVSEILATLGGQRKLEQFTTNNLILAKNREQTVSLLAKQLYAGIVVALTRQKDQVTAKTPTATDIATQIFPYDSTKIGVANVDVTSPLSVFTAANGKLSGGDPDTFLGFVQATERQALVRETFQTALIQTNQVVNADVGLMQQYTGYIDPFDGSAKFLANTGSFGVVNNVLMTWVDEQLWSGVYKLYRPAVGTSGQPGYVPAKIANWFGLDPTDGANADPTQATGDAAVINMLDQVAGILVAAQGTYHGVADDARVNVNPYAGRNPREMRIEPFARWGNAVLVPKSVKVFINTTTQWTVANIQAIAAAVPTIQPPANLPAA